MRLSTAVLSLLLCTGISVGVASAEQIDDDDDIIIVSVKPRSADVKPVVITLPAQAAHENATQSPALKFGGDSGIQEHPERATAKTTQNAVLSKL